MRSALLTGIGRWTRRHSCFTLEPVIRMLARGILQPERIITHRFPLARLEEGMELVRNYRDGVLKAIEEC